MMPALEFRIEPIDLSPLLELNDFDLEMFCMKLPAASFILII